MISMKNRMKSVRAQPVRPVSGLSERDGVFDQDMILAMKLQREEFEEGEIRGGRQMKIEAQYCKVICLKLRYIKIRF